MQRRTMLAGTGASLLTATAQLGAAKADTTRLPAGLPDGTEKVGHFAELPGKKRLLELTDRPPNYASLPEVFTDVVTPNDQFFVRYHMDGVPTQAALDNWSLTVGGDAAGKQVTLKLRDLLDLPQTDFLAVCQCSGNRRGFFEPHVAGVQWPDGGMGCARWSGPALKDVLALAGVKPEAVEVWFGGADTVPMDTIPRFHKSLPLQKAREPDTIVAVSMNNAPIPLLNGAPARLVVPGWTGTYWMKHLNSIQVSTKPLDNFWMKTAYRVPAGMFPVQMPFTTQATETTVPITEIVVNSLIADPLDGQEVERSGFTIRGVAWDRGNGIRQVEVSLDGGKTWWSALLDSPAGRYAYRRFTMQTGLMRPGTYELLSRATSNSGEKQATELKSNPGGYHNNVPRPMTVVVR